MAPLMTLLLSKKFYNPESVLYPVKHDKHEDQIHIWRDEIQAEISCHLLPKISLLLSHCARKYDTKGIIYPTVPMSYVA